METVEEHTAVLLDRTGQLQYIRAVQTQALPSGPVFELQRYSCSLQHRTCFVS